MYLRHESPTWTGLATFSKHLTAPIVQHMQLANAIAVGLIDSDNFTMEKANTPGQVDDWCQAASLPVTPEVILALLEKVTRKRDVYDNEDQHGERGEEEEEDSEECLVIT